MALPDDPKGPLSLPALSRLIEIVRALREPGGCPWDREQTLESLKPFLVEETYELIDAIESGDADKHKEELGDVLLQVLLQARIRAEAGSFDLEDVATALGDKLIRRHPHVFGDTKVNGTGEVLKNWEQIKASEKGATGKSVLAGVPRHLPALQKAQRIQSRAARVGFDWADVRDVVAKIEEELDEVREAMASQDSKELEAEIGDLLFAVVNLSRFQKIQAEEALERTNKKFMRRFAEVERRIRAEGKALKDCTLAEMDAHWTRVKEEE